MHYRNIRRALAGVAFFLALGAAGAWADPQPQIPAGSPQLAAGVPFRVRLYHVEFRVNPDFTYTERGEIRHELLNDMAVRMAQQMPVGVSFAPVPMMGGARKVEVVSAYTLKKDGQRVPAVPVEPAVLPKGLPPMPKSTLVAFPGAEIGDTVVFAYKATQQAADPPYNIALNMLMSRFMIWDDVQISVTAPAPMSLRMEMRGIDAPVHTVSGTSQTWTWKFSNPLAVTPKAGMRPGDFTANLHISSFPAANVEQAYYAKAMAGMRHAEVNLYDPCLTQFSPSDGPDGMNALTSMLTNFYLRDVANFERTVNGLNSPECVFDDGRPKLMALRDAYARAFSSSGGSWDKSYDYIEKLKAQFPDHPFVAMAEAEYWMSYAWDARGGGYSGTVTDEGWRRFSERLKRAESVLLQSKPYASRFPVWYEQMLQVQFLLQHRAEDQIAVFAEGTRRYPAYDPLYFTTAHYLSPKWGGDWHLLDRMVEGSVQVTEKYEGDAMYARLYWSVAQDMSSGDSLFRATRASWPRMKRGFEDLMARHPKSAWNLNNFAHFACMAGDRKTFRMLRTRMGKNVADAAWEGEPNLDLCEAKYGR